VLAGAPKPPVRMDAHGQEFFQAQFFADLFLWSKEANPEQCEEPGGLALEPFGRLDQTTPQNCGCDRASPAGNWRERAGHLHDCLGVNVAA
jgi:hypothetical protein